MIETPLVWSITDFFRDIAQIESQMRIELDYPYLMKDLNFKLHIRNASNGIDIKEKVTTLMGGEFKKDEMGRYYFDKKGQRIELVNTATGIKYFGIFQILSQNNYLNKNTVLILDEPEVHLHPKWQLEMAKIIVELVEKGVKIVVNSHSPYMIEALKRYSDLEKIENKTNFYLAEDGYIKQIDNSNSQTLVVIYEKLSEPYDVFEEMESDRFNNG
jgi:predicted ATPase